MSSQNYLVNQSISSSTNWASNVTSSAYPMTQYESAGFVFSWSGVTGTLTTTQFMLQVSNDGTNWADLISAVSVGTNGTGCSQVWTEKTSFNYIRSVAEVGTSSNGSFTITATFK